MGAAPHWELEEDGVLQGLFQEEEDDDGVQDGAGPEGVAALPPPPPPPQQNLELQAAFQELMEEIYGQPGNDPEEADNAGPEGVPALPPPPLPPQQPQPLEVAFEEEVYGQYGDDLEELPDAVDLEEADQAEGEVDYYFHTGDEYYSYLMEDNDTEEEQFPYPCYTITCLRDVEDLKAKPSVYSETKQYQIQSFRLSSVNTIIFRLWEMWGSREWQFVGNYRALATAEALLLVLEALGSLLDTLQGDFEQVCLSPDRVYALADFVDLLACHSAQHPSYVVVYLKSIQAQISAVIAVALNEDGRTRRSYDLDRSALQAQLQQLRSMVFDMKEVEMSYPPDPNPSQSSYLQMLYYKYDPAYRTGFWFSEESGGSSSSSTDADIEHTPLYDVSMTPENSDIEIEQLSPMSEPELDEDVSVLDEPVIIKSLGMLETIGDRPEWYMHCSQYVIRSHNLANANDMLNIINDIKWQRKWKPVRNLEGLKLIQKLQSTLCDLRTELDALTKQFKLYGSADLGAVSHPMSTIKMQAPLIPQRKVLRLVNQLIGAAEVFFAAVKHQGSATSDISTSAATSFLNNVPRLPATDILKLLAWVWNFVISVELCWVKYPIHEGSDDALDEGNTE